MNDDLERLRRWLGRAQPAPGDLLRASATGVLATAINVALVVGALALLVESSTRPGLRAVAVVLVVIELFAFVRSPLRFAERLSAHRLGYAAVTRWRRWLVVAIGGLDYAQWRTYASGDLLERALVDTDELQDLWLRFVIPLLDVTVVMVLADVVVASLPPLGHWWGAAAIMLLAQSGGVVALVAQARGELRDDRDVRAARGQLRAQVVELSAVVPELRLLRRESLAVARLRSATGELARAEARRDRHRLTSALTVLVASLGALAGTALHPRTSPVWLVVGAAIALATYDELTSARVALAAAVEVSGGGERLEALERPPRQGQQPWPEDATLRARALTLEEDGRRLLEASDLTVAPRARVALTGESGAGKSTMLRVLAGLDEPAGGVITIGDVPLREIAEDELRRHVAYVVSEPGFTRGFAIDVVTLGRDGTRSPHDDLAALGVASDRSTRFEELSRGERVRVALARALVTQPEIYLLDEPTAGLGSEETRRVLALLAATDAAIIVATHDPEVIEWCDEVVDLADARLRPSR